MKNHSKRAQRIGRLLDARLQVPKGYRVVLLYRSLTLSMAWHVELRRDRVNAFDMRLSLLSVYMLTPRDVLGHPWQVANRLAALLKDDVELLHARHLAESLG